MFSVVAGPVSFVNLPIFTSLFSEMASACGTPFLQSCRVPLENLTRQSSRDGENSNEAVDNSTSNSSKREQQFVGVMVASGLVRAICNDASANTKLEWDNWLQSQLRELLIQAPNEIYSEWCQGLRHAVAVSAEQQPNFNVQMELLQL